MQEALNEDRCLLPVDSRRREQIDGIERTKVDRVKVPGGRIELLNTAAAETACIDFRVDGLNVI